MAELPPVQEMIRVYPEPDTLLYDVLEESSWQDPQEEWEARLRGNHSPCFVMRAWTPAGAIWSRDLQRPVPVIGLFGKMGATHWIHYRAVN